MTQGQQPEALRLANALAYCDSSVASQAAAELRRLHAENVTLQQGYDSARLEIDSLQARVQELGAMLRENRSKRIVELEARLEAIGAGGVEPLRRRECLHQISEPETASQPPAGWVMVPEVPDERMERAIAGAFCGTVYEARKAWESGIAAAPKAEAANPGFLTEFNEINGLPAGEYPALPAPFIGVQDQPWGGHAEVIRSAIGEDGVVSCYTADQMRAYVDADRAMRAQAAPAAVVPPLTKLQRKAIAVCFTSDKVSVSEVQRKLSISYADAQTLCQSVVDLGLADELELAPSLKRGAPAPQAAPAAQGDALARAEALHEAVAAIYFDDGSKFKSALGAVVRHLDKKLAADLLGFPKRAFDTSLAQLYAARSQAKEGGA